MPFDSATLLTIAFAAAAFGVAAFATRNTRVRLIAILLAAAALRVDSARQSSLHLWDESVHAVVAKRLMSHPLTPTLYERLDAAPDPLDWTERHVWLHKPPLAMWLMAASMGAAGVSAMAMRLPGVLLSVLGVFLTFLIGRRLFGPSVGLLAAAFHAVNGLLATLAAGRRVADHVDTALVACVELGAFLLIRSPAGSRGRWMPLLAGVAMGAGVLTKSAPALLVGVLALVMWIDRRAMRRGLLKLALLSAGALAAAGPWIAYTHAGFPEAARAAAAYTLLHMSSVVEGHGGSFWSYLLDMPKQFGELIYVPVAWFVVRALRPDAARTDRVLLAWLATPYLVFSAMPTKLPAFIAIAAPALFLVQAVFWCDLRDRFRQASGGRRLALAAALALLAVLPARLLLEPTGVLERRDRHPPATRQLMALERDLGLTDAAIFNMPHAFEAMFYSRYAAYRRMPRPEEIAELRRRGVPIVVFVPAGTKVEVPAGWDARLLNESVR